MVTKYLEGFQYVGNVLQYLPTAEGYAARQGSSYTYVYQYKDHLGNVRVSYSRDPQTGIARIVEENNYYPYGLQHSGYNNDVWLNQANTEGQKITFNSRELQNEFDLFVVAMDFRQYDSALGRFTAMDLLTEKYLSFTPYQFGNNNPVYWADPSGLSSVSSEFSHDFMGRERFDRFGMFIIPNERQFRSITAINGGDDGGNGVSAFASFESVDAILSYIYAKMISQNSNRILMEDNKNGSFTFTWWTQYAVTSSTEFYLSSITEKMEPHVDLIAKKVVETVFLNSGLTPWMNVAKSQIGVRELTNNNDGVDVEKYLKSGGLGKGYPWCGAFVNWVFINSGIEVKGVNGNPNRALNWRGFGKNIDKPAYGAVATKTRKGGGHVGFVAGLTSNGSIVILGGNQNDSVNYTVYPPGTSFQYNFPNGYNPNYNLPTLNIIGGKIKEN